MGEHSKGGLSRAERLMRRLPCNLGHMLCTVAWPGEKYTHLRYTLESRPNVCANGLDVSTQLCLQDFSKGVVFTNMDQVE